MRFELATSFAASSSTASRVCTPSLRFFEAAFRSAVTTPAGEHHREDSGREPRAVPASSASVRCERRESAAFGLSTSAPLCRRPRQMDPGDRTAPVSVRLSYRHSRLLLELHAFFLLRSAIHLMVLRPRRGPFSWP